MVRRLYYVGGGISDSQDPICHSHFRLVPVLMPMLMVLFLVAFVVTQMQQQHPTAEQMLMH